MENKKKIIKNREGIVISNKMDKTVVVKIERVFRHPLFKKVVKSYKNFKAHDPKNSCQIGDKVVIVEIRPLSKDKRWKVKEVIGHAKVVEKVHPGRLHKEVKEEEPVVDQPVETIHELSKEEQ